LEDGATEEGGFEGIVLLTTVGIVVAAMLAASGLPVVGNARRKPRGR
jgi:hypothetical protein